MFVVASQSSNSRRYNQLHTEMQIIKSMCQHSRCGMSQLWIMHVLYHIPKCASFIMASDSGAVWLWCNQYQLNCFFTSQNPVYACDFEQKCQLRKQVESCCATPATHKITHTSEHFNTKPASFSVISQQRRDRNKEPNPLDVSVACSLTWTLRVQEWTKTKTGQEGETGEGIPWVQSYVQQECTGACSLM